VVDQRKDVFQYMHYSFEMTGLNQSLQQRHSITAKLLQTVMKNISKEFMLLDLDSHPDCY